MWEWMAALALCGINTEEYFAGTDVPTNAYRKGGDDVVCVRCSSLGVTLNWYRSRDGRVRIDGPSDRRPSALAMLRKSHPAYVCGATAHGAVTGRQAVSSKVGASREKTELSARAEWEKAQKDVSPKVCVTSSQHSAHMCLAAPSK